VKREGESDDRWGRAVGERERGIGVGLVRGKLGRLAPGVGPVGLLASSFYFYFSSAFFSLFLNFCFEF
jgi:hypothetical protein